MVRPLPPESDLGMAVDLRSFKQARYEGILLEEPFALRE